MRQTCRRINLTGAVSPFCRKLLFFFFSVLLFLTLFTVSASLFLSLSQRCLPSRRRSAAFYARIPGITLLPASSMVIKLATRMPCRTFLSRFTVWPCRLLHSFPVLEPLLFFLSFFCLLRIRIQLSLPLFIPAVLVLGSLSVQILVESPFIFFSSCLITRGT